MNSQYDWLCVHILNHSHWIALWYFLLTNEIFVKYRYRHEWTVVAHYRWRMYKLHKKGKWCYFPSVAYKNTNTNIFYNKEKFIGTLSFRKTASLQYNFKIQVLLSAIFPINPKSISSITTWSTAIPWPQRSRSSILWTSWFGWWAFTMSYSFSHFTTFNYKLQFREQFFGEWNLFQKKT